VFENLEVEMEDDDFYAGSGVKPAAQRGVRAAFNAKKFLLFEEKSLSGRKRQLGKRPKISCRRI